MLYRSQLKQVLDDLNYRYPEELLPLPLDKIAPVLPFTKYGKLTVEHLQTHYSVFYEYLEYHNQVYDMIYPIQQMLQYRDAQLMERLSRQQNLPLAWPHSPAEEEARMWAADTLEHSLPEDIGLLVTQQMPEGMAPFDYLNT